MSIVSTTVICDLVKHNISKFWRGHNNNCHNHVLLSPRSCLPGVGFFPSVPSHARGASFSPSAHTHPSSSSLAHERRLTTILFPQIEGLPKAAAKTAIKWPVFSRLATYLPTAIGSSFPWALPFWRLVLERSAATCWQGETRVKIIAAVVIDFLCLLPAT